MTTTTTARPLAGQDATDRARLLGAAAYHRPDALAAPATDPAMTALLAGVRVGDGLPLLAAWQDGWHAAADAEAGHAADLLAPRPTVAAVLCAPAHRLTAPDSPDLDGTAMHGLWDRQRAAYARTGLWDRPALLTAYAELLAAGTDPFDLTVRAVCPRHAADGTPAALCRPCRDLDAEPDYEARAARRADDRDAR